jgi:site-specific DNA-methyltransferase (adenine-specific)
VILLKTKIGFMEYKNLIGGAITDKINIYNCDCMELLKQTPDNYYSLALVDPPYGIGEDGAKNHSRGKATKPTMYTAKDWDSSAPTKEYFIELKRVCKNVIIWGANHFIELIPNANTPSWIVWDKQNGENDFADCELAYTSFNTAVRKFEFRWAGMLQGDMKNKEIRIHPTQKPVQLYKWLLDKYAKPNDKILDTHLGSMSIAIACHDYGFDLTGCELDPEYYAKGIERVQRHVSQQKLF